jgi:cytochrome c553
MGVSRPRFLWALTALLCLHAGEVEDAALRVLSTHCLVCHGETRMAGLDLRTRESLLKGGARGPAIHPGKPAESLLMRAVRRTGDLKMPPGKNALGAEETEALEKWISGGAHWSGEVRQETSAWWSFRKVQRPINAPAANVIDFYIDEAIRSRKLQPAAKADRLTLIRRATFDLHGLPPTPAEIDAFLNDTGADAWPRLIDRLLESPRYGERWARHWLDVVRYADTGGFETDVLFPSAWRYRDYVIRSFNSDKPYFDFIREQIAADEIWPDNLDLDGSYELPASKRANLEKRLGTALYTLGAFPVEYTFFGDQYRAEWQAEAVETTGAAFLGLSLNCARCHDHKFDPISQRDYYRMSALFAGSEDRQVPIVSQMAIFEYTRYQTKLMMADQWKARYQRLMASIRKRQPTPAERDEQATLLRKIGEAYVKAPVPYATANLLAHTAPVPDTHVLIRGEFKQRGAKATPGFPAALGPAPPIVEPDTPWFIPRRRKALAEWLASPDHPLTARVMVNRMWQGHFGRGLVATSNDFGRQGDPPSHPELLDWLASEFIASNGSIKQMHRRIMLSEAYQRSSEPVAANMSIDADNRYLWRMNRRRLESEALRDSVLAASGALNTKMFGEPVVPQLSSEEMDGMRDLTQWPVTTDPAEHHRRSIYLFVKRSFRNPLLETFDAPDASFSCPRRESSTVAPQSLAMMNSEFLQKQAQRFAERLSKLPTANERIGSAWRIALGRPPQPEEKSRAAAYVEKAGLAKLCLLLFNMNEFLYVD